MQNKAPLALIELLIMLLVFALASGLCLQAFSSAKQSSLYNIKQDAAVLQAQNAAELLKYYHGDFYAAAEHMGGTSDDFCWSINYDKNWNIVSDEGIYQLSVIKREHDSILRGQADISIYDETNTVLCALSVAWQEVGNQ